MGATSTGGNDPRYDVIVIGGGPAGLSAALMLGRCGRSTLLVDGNEPRNAASRALHGYLTQDGISPQALREKGRADLARYPSVTLRDATANSVRSESPGFRVTLEDGTVVRSRLLLLATGRVDPLPELPGFERFFGRGVYHCPYCDGWENRGRRIGVIGNDVAARELAATLLTWSSDVTIFAHEKPEWPLPPRAPTRVQLAPVAGLEGMDKLQAVRLGNGTFVPCDALFFATACAQRSPLPAELGCRFDDEAAVRCQGHCAEGVDGLYVAGNVRGGVHLAITAAAEGAEAAIAINAALGPPLGGG